MLKTSASRNLCHLYSPKRPFVTTSLVTGVLSHFFLGKDAKGADKIGANDGTNEGGKNWSELVLFDKRPMEPQYKGHIPLYPHEKLLLFIASSLKSYYHPEDGINIVQLGEATAFPWWLESLKQTMLKDDVGRTILREKPNISLETLESFRYLARDPKYSKTLGATYFKWLDKEGVGPETRAPVKYIDNPDHAYIFKRYRQCHDFYHSINDLPINIEGEITVKCLEACNIGVPMAALGALFAPLRLSKYQRARLYDVYLPWATKTGLKSNPLINVYWEKIMTKDIDEVRTMLNISKPPDLRQLKKDQQRMRRELRTRYDH